VIETALSQQELAAPALAEAAKEEKEERRKDEVGKWCDLVWYAAGCAPRRHRDSIHQLAVDKATALVKSNNSRFIQRRSYAGWKSDGFRGARSRASMPI